MKKHKSSKFGFYWHRTLVRLLPALVGLALCHAPYYLVAQTCEIDSIIAFNITGCNDNGTIEPWDDDTFTADVRVVFHDNPVTGHLKLTGPRLVASDSIPVGMIGTGDTSFTFSAVSMRAVVDEMNINLTASFTGALPSCTFTDTNAGLVFRDSVWESVKGPRQCSVCPNPEGGGVGGAYPDCWPSENPASVCENSINYAPDPENPELTPMRYIKTVIHVFHKEDPDSVAQGVRGVVHPTDPDNYTEDHLDVFASWFNHPDGINGFLANLCDDPTDSSPHMTDARFRLINSGTVGHDVFFHPDNQGWGTGFFPCWPNDSTNLGDTDLYSVISTARYITGPHPAWISQEYLDSLAKPEIANAMHVFIGRGTWIENDTVAGPSDGDCYQFWPGGFVRPNAYECDASGNPPSSPAQFLYGSYEAYLRLTDSTYVSQVTSNIDSLTVPGLGRGLIGELYHMLSLDHISPLQAHIAHANGDDGCEDTEWGSEFNVLGCNFDGNRCALTQCQLGRIHHFFSKLNPPFQRFPDDTIGFNCDIIDPDIIIETGTDTVWTGIRNLRSNIIVEPGAKLTITCDLGMAAGATISVQPSGKLYIDGARIYSNCDQPWGGIEAVGDKNEHQYVVGGQRKQGYVNIRAGSVIENAIVGVINQAANDPTSTGGVIIANEATFLNNRVGAMFGPYQNTNYLTNEASGDISLFTACKFIVDGDLPGVGGGFQSHANLHGIYGLRFIGCTFANDMPDAMTPNGLRGYGVRATASEFTVQAECLSTTHPCTSLLRSEFRGLLYGISAAKSVQSKTFKVSNTDFKGNCYGIFSLGIDNVYVVKSNFEVGFGLAASNPFQGINLTSGTGYKIEGNSFVPHSTALAGHTTVGVRVGHSGSVYNEIYRNDFADLDYANLANGDNRGVNDDIGLQYLCNTDTLNRYDITVVDSNLLSVVGIAQNQGSANEAAGNTFTPNPTQALGHIWNEEGAISYFYFGTPPSNVSSTVLTDEAESDNLCPSKVPFKEEGHLTELEHQQEESDFENSTDPKKRSYAADMLVRHYLTDTAAISFDSARYYLYGKGGLFAHFQIVDTWLQEGELDSAEQVLADIPLVFALTGDELTEYEHFDTLKTLQIAAIRNKSDNAKLVSDHLAAITDVADAGPYLASSQAKALLNEVNGPVYGPGVTLPTAAQQGLLAPPPGAGEVATGAATLAAVPNPATGKVSFHFSLPDGARAAELVVTDLNGRTVRRFIVMENRGKVDWDVSGLEGGVYGLSLIPENTAPVTTRFVIAK